jgi:hypothetical protein
MIDDGRWIEHQEISVISSAQMIIDHHPQTIIHHRKTIIHS